MLSSQAPSGGLGWCLKGPCSSPLTLAIRGYGSMIPISASSEPLGKHGPLAGTNWGVGRKDEMIPALQSLF